MMVEIKQNSNEQAYQTELELRRQFGITEEGEEEVAVDYEEEEATE